MRLSVWLIPAGVATTVAAVSIFALGAAYGRASSGGASLEEGMQALRAEVTAVSDRVRSVESAGNGDGMRDSRGTALAASIKADLAKEMGLVPLALLRERRSSFVALHAVDRSGETRYGTAGYLGNGYFLTVKHIVVSLSEGGRGGESAVQSITIVDRERELPATLVDAGNALSEVDPGDWAIIKTEPLDLPALEVDAAFAYEFAEPIVRFGNDYSKGIVAASGYVGQKTAAGLVTCLTDGHPGVSGGGVLDRRGRLIGIPVGRMREDYRFSFILPVRAEMFRKVRPQLPSAALHAAVEGRSSERVPEVARVETTGH